jgi:hypothetical protein
MAVEFTARVTSPNQFDDAFMRVTRGRISLARGDFEGALSDADTIANHAITSQNDELLYEGLALLTLIHTAQSDSAAAQAACDRYLTHWQAQSGMLTRVLTLCEIAPTLAACGRLTELRDAALLLPDVLRWREPILLTTDQHYADAAELYKHLGSHPLAADAHLLAARQAWEQGDAADAAAHADAIIGFAERTGSTLHQRQAERCVAAIRRTAK